MMNNQKAIDAINKRLEIVRTDMQEDNLIMNDESNPFVLRNVAFARWNCRTNEEKFLLYFLSTVEVE